MYRRQKSGSLQLTSVAHLPRMASSALTTSVSSSSSHSTTACNRASALAKPTKSNPSSSVLILAHLSTTLLTILLESPPPLLSCSNCPLRRWCSQWVMAHFFLALCALLGGSPLPPWLQAPSPECHSCILPCLLDQLYRESNFTLATHTQDRAHCLIPKHLLFLHSLS